MSALQKQLSVMENLRKLLDVLSSGQFTPKQRGYLVDASSALCEYIKFVDKPIDPETTRGRVI